MIPEPNVRAWFRRQHATLIGRAWSHDDEDDFTDWFTKAATEMSGWPCGHNSVDTFGSGAGRRVDVCMGCGQVLRFWNVNDEEDDRGQGK